MRRSLVLFCGLFLLSFLGYGQRPHLEIGANVSAKEELHKTPSFDSTAQSLNFQLYGINLITRISKRRLGGELGFGFEKAGNYTLQSIGNSDQSAYINLNRLVLNISPYAYILKKAVSKWDVQLGLHNSFNLNSQVLIPDAQFLRAWKMSGRCATNFTYKSLMVGLYYERDLRSDFYFDSKDATFGVRLGVIY